MEVACRQLGFTGGEWYFWHLHLNDTVQILYEDPGKTKIREIKKLCPFITVRTNLKCQLKCYKHHWSQPLDLVKQSWTTTGSDREPTIAGEPRP